MSSTTRPMTTAQREAAQRRHLAALTRKAARELARARVAVEAACDAYAEHGFRNNREESDAWRTLVDAAGPVARAVEHLATVPAVTR